MKNLSKLRTMNNMSRQDIGNIVGVSASAVAKWEIGEREMPYDKLIALADYFNVTTDILLDHKELSFIELDDKLDFRNLYQQMNEAQRNELLEYGAYIIERDKRKKRLAAARRATL